MSNICKTVTLRTRKIKGGEQLSFYLDYYPGYRDESTMKVMRHESLGIYIYAKPKSQREKDYNDRMREKAEALRCRRYESIVNERYDFFDKEKMKGSFLDYFKDKAEKKGGATRLPSVSGRAPHQVGECLHALREVHQGQVPLRRDQCRSLQQVLRRAKRQADYKEYLMTAHQLKHTEYTLHINSIAGYWSTFRAVLHTAYREHI